MSLTTSDTTWTSKPSSVTYSWTSNDTTIIDIKSGGNSLSPTLDYKKPGSTTLTLTASANSSSFSTNVNVTINYASITDFTYTGETKMSLNDTLEISSTVTPSNADPRIAWTILSSSTASGYSINNNIITTSNATAGTIKLQGISNGKTSGGVSITKVIEITVEADPSVTISPESLSGFTGQYGDLTAEVKDLSGCSYEWVTNAPSSILTLTPSSNTCRVSYIGPTANNTITVNCYIDSNGNGQRDSGESIKCSDTIDVQILQSTHSLSVSPASLNFSTNGSSQNLVATATVTGMYSNKITISYSNTAFDVKSGNTIISSGSQIDSGITLKVVPKTDQVCNNIPITFTANGDTATCSVTISDVPVSNFIITPTTTSIYNGESTEIIISGVNSDATKPVVHCSVDSGYLLINKTEFSYNFNGSNILQITGKNTSSENVTATVSIYLQTNGHETTEIKTCSVTIMPSYSVDGLNIHEGSKIYTGENLVEEDFIYWDPNGSDSFEKLKCDDPNPRFSKEKSTDWDIWYWYVTCTLYNGTEGFGSTYKKITSNDKLIPGERYIFLARNGSNTYALSSEQVSSDQALYNKNIKVNPTVIDGVNTMTVSELENPMIQIFEFEEGSYSNTFKMKAVNGVNENKYCYYSNSISGSKKNNLSFGTASDISQNDPGYENWYISYNSNSEVRAFEITNALADNTRKLQLSTNNTDDSRYIFNTYNNSVDKTLKEKLRQIDIYKCERTEKTTTNVFLSDSLTTISTTPGKPSSSKPFDLIGGSTINIHNTSERCITISNEISKYNQHPTGSNTKFNPTTYCPNTFIVYVPKQSTSYDYGTISIQYLTDDGLSSPRLVKRDGSIVDINNAGHRDGYIDISINGGNINELSYAAMTTAANVTGTATDYYAFVFTSDSGSTTKICDAAYCFNKINTNSHGFNASMVNYSQNVSFYIPETQNFTELEFTQSSTTISGKTVKRFIFTVYGTFNEFQILNNDPMGSYISVNSSVLWMGYTSLNIDRAKP